VQRAGPQRRTRRRLPAARPAARNLGVSVHEALWLEDWAADCAQDHVFDAFYVAAPLRIARGTGAPMNPIVIKLGW
jgi:hypothetical protein